MENKIKIIPKECLFTDFLDHLEYPNDILLTKVLNIITKAGYINLEEIFIEDPNSLLYRYRSLGIKSWFNFYRYLTKFSFELHYDYRFLYMKIIYKSNATKEDKTEIKKLRLEIIKNNLVKLRDEDINILHNRLESIELEKDECIKKLDTEKSYVTFLLKIQKEL